MNQRRCEEKEKERRVEFFSLLLLSDLVTIECLLRPYEVKSFAFDAIVPPVPRKRKQEAQTASSSASASPATPARTTTPQNSQKKTKKKVGDEEGEEEGGEGDDNDGEDEAEKNENEQEKQEEEEATPIVILPSPAPAAPSSSLALAPSQNPLAPLPPSTSVKQSAAATPRALPAARPETAIRGHTSFLTFARRMIL